MDDSPGERRAKRYNAFISYRQDPDKDLAADLRTSLQSFWKPWYGIRPFMKIAVDITSLGASDDLERTIDERLDQSDHLVLMLSKQSPTAYWTGEETQHWVDAHGGEAITYVVSDWEGELTDYKWADDVPAALRKVNGERLRQNPNWQPLAVDLREHRGPDSRNEEDEGWHGVVASVAAGIMGVPKEDFDKHLRALRLRARVLSGTVAFGVLLLLGGLLLAGVSWRIADQAADRAEDAQAAAELARDQATEDKKDAEEAAARADELALVAENKRLDAVEARRLADKATLQAEENEALAAKREAAAMLAEKVARDAKQTAEEAQDDAEELQAIAEASARAAGVLATAAEAEAFGRELEATALVAAGNDSPLALALGAAAYCQLDAPNCPGGAIEPVGFRSLAMTRQVDGLSTLFTITRPMAGVEAFLTSERVATAGISRDGSTVAIVERPVAGNDIVRIYRGGRAHGAVVFDAWPCDSRLEVGAVALSAEGDTLAVAAWPAFGFNSNTGTRLVMTSIDGATRDLSLALHNVGGDEFDGRPSRLDVVGGADDLLVLSNARRFGVVSREELFGDPGGPCCTRPSAYPTVGPGDTAASCPTESVLNRFGASAVTPEGTLLAGAECGYTEHTLPDLVQIAAVCEPGWPEPAVLARGRIESGTITVLGDDAQLRVVFEPDDDSGGWDEPVDFEHPFGSSPDAVEIIESPPTMRALGRDGWQQWRILKGQFPSSLPDVSEGRVAAVRDLEVVFSKDGAHLHTFREDPVVGWRRETGDPLTVGLEDGIDPVFGPRFEWLGRVDLGVGVAVLGTRVMTWASEPVVGPDCESCGGGAVADDGSVVFFENGLIAGPDGSRRHDLQLPGPFGRKIAVSPRGKFGVIETGDPDRPVLRVIDLRSGAETWARGIPGPLVQAVVTDDGTVVADLSDLSVIVVTGDSAAPFRVIRDGTGEQFTLELTSAGNSVWGLDTGGIVWELQDPGSPGATAVVRLKHVGFSPVGAIDATDEGDLIALGLDDGTVELWMPGGDKPLLAGLVGLTEFGGVNFVDIGVDSTGLRVTAVGAGTGVVVSQPLDPSRVLSAVCDVANRTLTAAEWTVLGGTGPPLGCAP